MRNPFPLGRRSGAGAALAFAAFLALVGVLYLSVSLTARNPEITELQSPIAEPGEVLTIRGRHFGEDRGSGRIRIAGRYPVTSSYISWSDEEIRLRLPDDVRSGLLYVETEQGESEGRLFTNRLQLPRNADETLEHPGRPRITDLSPSEAAVGETVTIRGTNFGRRRSAGRVLFLPGTVQPPSRQPPITLAALDHNPLERGLQNVATPSIKLGEYQSWENRSITVTVPDGAESGTLVVVTDRGSSNPVAFDLARPVGEKRFHDKRSFAFREELIVEHITTNPHAFEFEQNALQLWLPAPIDSPVQRNRQTLRRNAEPMFRSPEGFEQFEYRNLGPRDRIQLTHVQMVDRYAVETSISGASVPNSYNTDSQLVRRYTAADRYVPADDDEIRSRAARSVGNQRNPYRKAEQLFGQVRSLLSPDTGGNGWDARAAFDRGAGDAFDYAALYVALLRAVDVPARVVSGYLVPPDLEALRHHWAEFYLPSFGWVPADPALADGMHAEVFTEAAIGNEDPAGYYFGNLDSRRVAFSNGVVRIPALQPDAREREPRYRYALLTRYEQLSGNLSGYTSRWKPVRFLGEY